jgi:beta-galactosidase
MLDSEYMKKAARILPASLCALLALGAQGFGEGEDRSPADNLLIDSQWEFTSGSVKGIIEKNIEPGDHGTEITIRKADTTAHDHVWWRQKLSADGGDAYHLSLEAKGTGVADHRIYVGVDFLSSDGKFAGFKQIGNVCYDVVKIPSATVPDVKDWTSFEGNFTVPRGASDLSIRLALDATGPAEADFRNVVLTKTSVPVMAVLDRLPDEIPVEQISLKPVSAEGITLKPNWELRGAEVVESKTRTRVCLNGLWAIQPAGRNEGPTADDWAFMKVPDVLQSGDPYFAYGQAETSWKSENLFSDAAAIWFVRDVEIPASNYSTIGVEFQYFRGLALAIYWNGKRIGILTNQLGGEIDLSSLARPGDKGQLAVYALALPPESQYSYLMEAGQMPRQYDASNFIREPNRSLYYRGLSDVYLHLGPAQPVFETVQAAPSTRKKTLGIWITGPPGAASLNYGVTIQGADGAVVLQKDGLRAERRDGGCVLDIPWENPRAWTPDDPYLYRLTVRASADNGKLVDETLPISFGFREIWVEGKQLMLNGRPLHLRPLLAFTSYMDGPALRRHFSFIKDMGFNCLIRPWAGTTSELEVYDQQSLGDFYGTADNLGLFIIPYTPYVIISRGQFGTGGAASIDLDRLMAYLRKNQVERLANHPSVIAYSGFGGGYSEGINYIDDRPDTWGVTPLAHEDILEKVLSSPVHRKEALANMLHSKEFIQRFKALDPTRPFLSHIDTGEGDGWGIFDYFNWTPVQEWEEWPMHWWKAGIMPIGSTEHGMPYPASFMNHAIPDGTNEPWVTEYAASEIGPQAYANETAAYLDLLRSDYDKAAGNWRPLTSVFDSRWANVQAVWDFNTKAIYRAWRTYGVPMGIEPFGRLDEILDQPLLRKGSGQVVADPNQDLRTPGAKLDRWNFFAYWPSATMPWLPESPTGQPPTGLTPLGELLHDVNGPLLVYLAGPRERPTAKDHVFVEGEMISKQIAAIWDGFSERGLELSWKAQVDGKTVGQGNQKVTLKSGDIQYLPVEFSAPPVKERSEGTIEVEVSDATSGAAVSHDSFAFQVYPVLTLSGAARKARIVLFDPTGASVAALTRLGLSPSVIKNLSDWNGGDILVVGRGALPELGRQSLDTLPGTVPVLVLEQPVTALENLGLRTYPVRTRLVFPLTSDHPVFRGVQAPDLCDWRVEPKLLPSGVEPLRDGYNYHTGYYGTVDSVTIEVPTRGNFTPLLQGGFDLRETPLLEANLKGRRWIFCQLSVVDPMPGSAPEAGDPVGARILANLIDYLATDPPASPVPFGVLGDDSDLDLTGELGASVLHPVRVDQLKGVKVALVGNTKAPPAALQSWVEQGGLAVVLPQAQEFYAACLPSVSVTSRTASIAPVPVGHMFDGLGQGDFHYRQPLPLLGFNGDPDAAEIPAGKGRWILVGFDPRRLDLQEAPWLRLTYRHECRALAQILTNLGVALDRPGQTMAGQINQAPFGIDLEATGKARLTEKQKDMTEDWVKPDFDATDWSPFDLAGQTTTYGTACLRISFFAPKDVIARNLVADLGTMDDFDETWLNGVKIGSVDPENTNPETAYRTPRLYPIPAGLLKPGEENVLAILTWNRNAAKGAAAQVRGPMVIRTAEAAGSPYVGEYKHSDDPYLQHHW